MAFEEITPAFSPSVYRRVR